MYDVFFHCSSYKNGCKGNDFLYKMSIIPSRMSNFA